MASKKKALGQTDFSVLVRHVRQMVRAPDPLSILVRGMILIDNVLDSLIDEFSAVPFDKLDEVIHHLTLAEKSHMACALGAISHGELACIKEINRRRNELAHRLDITVLQKDEEHIVNVFANQTRIFSGLNYDPRGFPRTLIFVLVVLFYLLHMRVGQGSQKIEHKPDETNLLAMGAITMTRATVDAVFLHVEGDDEKIWRNVEKHVAEAKRLRDEENERASKAPEPRA